MAPNRGGVSLYQPLELDQNRLFKALSPCPPGWAAVPRWRARRGTALLCTSDTILSLGCKCSKRWSSLSVGNGSFESPSCDTWWRGDLSIFIFNHDTNCPHKLCLDPVYLQGFSFGQELCLRDWTPVSPLKTSKFIGFEGMKEKKERSIFSVLIIFGISAISLQWRLLWVFFRIVVTCF